MQQAAAQSAIYSQRSFWVGWIPWALRVFAPIPRLALAQLRCAQRSCAAQLRCALASLRFGY